MIPDFQSLMLPLLKIGADGKEHSTTEAVNVLAEQFKLTDEELNQLLPSGTQRIFYNRVHWAKAYLKMGGLIENTKKGHFKISVNGGNVLQEDLDKIDLKYLKKLPAFIQTKQSWAEDNHLNEGTDTEIKTPEEIIQNAFQAINSSLANDLLIKVKECSWTFFEKLVVELLVAMGYGGSHKEAGKVIGKSGDEGIDGIIKEDKLGLDVIYVQAKQWQGSIGRPEIQKFMGALAGQGAKKGVFITTSKFTEEAKAYLPKNETKIVLVDGESLVQLMIDHNIGISVKDTYTIKAVDNDFFVEE
jgi:restriction system protein